MRGVVGTAGNRLGGRLDWRKKGGGGGGGREAGGGMGGGRERWEKEREREEGEMERDGGRVEGRRLGAFIGRTFTHLLLADSPGSQFCLRHPRILRNR